MTDPLVPALAALRQALPQGGRILCAVSGGLDSMCLLHFLAEDTDFPVTAAHFNHQLRPTASRDEAFVRDWCRERGIPFLAGRGDVAALAGAEGLSLEEAARKARYAFLAEAAEGGGFAAVCTAHHARDNAETMLLNLIRGTGSAGLRGMRQVRPLGAGEAVLLRPFLRIEPQALAAYAAENAIPHVEDETNRSDGPARNRLRHQVLPVLESINPQALAHMSAAAETLLREEEAITALAEDLAGRAAVAQGGLRIPVQDLLEAPAAVAEQAVLRLLAAVARERQDLGAAHVKAILSLPPGGEGTLPYGLLARREGAFLTITRRSVREAAPLLPDVPLRWGRFTLTLQPRREGEGLLLRAGDEPLRVAPLTGGERLCLPGTRGGSRTVKRLCRDRGLSFRAREELPGVFLGGELAAVWPFGTDEKFLPSGPACRFIQIRSETE